ncbi:hypothetical protein [Mycobacteroides abscessus]|uniref:hypothetical protein n=1 Tax=Mycobacteroides abscessus TaxID=36809 RepID=UPI0021050B80|nr:hypothetical protein [Mycobacteroides abscessus]
MSDERSIEDRLTPAARSALDAFINEARAEILNEANAISASLSDYSEIGVSEVLQAIKGQEGQRESDKLRASELRLNRFRLLTAVASAMGAALLVLGFTSYAIHAASSIRSPTSTWIALSTSVGLSLLAASFSAYYLTISRRRYRLAEESNERQGQRSLGEFLVRWNEFGRAVDQFVAERFGESAVSQGLGKKLVLLDDHGVITSEDTYEVRRLYDMRNRLVHGTSGDQPTQEQIQAALADLAKLQTKLAQATKS